MGRGERMSPKPLLPRLLFALVCLLALALLGLLLAAPWIDSSSRLLALFARDETVRRTTLASALGLIVTASVFFRAPSSPDEPSRNRSGTAPPPGAVGA